MERNSENKMTGRNPKVFISYSWENKENKEWARDLADKLLKNGIDAYIDQYDLSLGVFCKTSAPPCMYVYLATNNSRITCDFFASIRLFLYLLPHASWIFFDHGIYSSSTSLL